MVKFNKRLNDRVINDLKSMEAWDINRTVRLVDELATDFRRYLESEVSIEPRYPSFSFPQILGSPKPR